MEHKLIVLQQEHTTQQQKPSDTKVGVEFYALCVAMKNLQNNEEALKRRQGSSRKMCEGSKLRWYDSPVNPWDTIPTHTQALDQQILNDSPINPAIPPGWKPQATWVWTTNPELFHLRTYKPSGQMLLVVGAGTQISLKTPQMQTPLSHKKHGTDERTPVQTTVNM